MEVKLDEYQSAAHGMQENNKFDITITVLSVDPVARSCMWSCQQGRVKLK